MELITRNNLDQWLFDYFEGNLQEEQSLQLHKFVNENPDLKTEWEHWQKTYLSEPLPSDKVFVESLKKKYFWQQKGFYWTVSMLVLTGVLFLTLFENDPTSDTKEIRTEEKALSPVAIPDVIPQQLPEKKQQVVQIKKAPTVQRNTIATTDSSSAFQKEATTSFIQKEEKSNNTTLSIQKDTIAGPSQVVDTKESNDSKIKKEKKRRKRDLTPSDQIIKTNPNF